MLAKSASPTDRVMEKQGGQQLPPTQYVGSSAGLMPALVESIEFCPAEALEQQGQEAAAIIGRMTQSTLGWR